MKLTKAFLKRYPKLYNFLKRGYSIARAFMHSMHRNLLGTKLEEKYWATKHLHEGNDWVRDYWDSRNHSHRSFLVERISRFFPSSIIEIGCNCGPNLYLLAKKFPDAKIVGIDINSMVIQKGNDWFKQEGISNAKLLVGKADDLSQFQDKSFDVTFTDAVLIYIGPDKIKKVVEEMFRVTRKALIFLEWHSFRSNPLGVYAGHWMRDYVILLKEFIPENKIRVIKMPKELMYVDQNWQKWGAVIEVVM